MASRELATAMAQQKHDLESALFTLLPDSDRRIAREAKQIEFGEQSEMALNKSSSPNSVFGEQCCDRCRQMRRAGMDLQIMLCCRQPGFSRG